MAREATGRAGDNAASRIRRISLRACGPGSYEWAEKEGDELFRGWKIDEGARLASCEARGPRWVEDLSRRHWMGDGASVRDRKHAADLFGNDATGDYTAGSGSGH